ncbi:MAG: hypothetical protein JWL90_2601, partial [Chthoniobacteraceae bacterium]|nr:hypothetical protein [Chthoniobacteraceae bacterium]
MLKKLLGSRFRILVALVLLAPCIFISVPAIIAYRAERQLKEASGWVSHTLEVERRV